MAKLYDLVVKTGTYVDGSGQEKGRYENIGAVMQGNDGGKFIMLKRTFNPAGVPDLDGRNSDSILVGLYEPQGQQQGQGQQRQQQAPQQQQQRPPQQQQQQQPQQQYQQANQNMDDIPF